MKDPDMLPTPDELLERLAAFELDAEALAFRDDAALSQHLNALEGVEVTSIGRSRSDRELFGLRFGNGPRSVSIIAGCHADEPIGPMTAQIFSTILHRHFSEFLDAFRFHVVPQMNPDGAEANRAWFRDPLELSVYLNHVVRELPGDDLEFGFGSGADVRPECRAAQDFLGSHAPHTAHFSLHGMGFAEGVWCLICKEWTEGSDSFMNIYERLCRRMGMALHDIERNGEKGFTRIREGFCTTPTAEAMKAYFMERNDHAMAGRFKPASMDWIQSLGGDPLCMVSELPLFNMGRRSASPDEPLSVELKEDLARLRAAHPTLEAGHLEALCRDYEITPTPIDLQLRLQVGLILFALATLPDPC